MRVFIPPVLATTSTNADILRGQREVLGLTQQQVADGAGILLRQYQRFEFGERDITRTNASTFLAVCAVLHLQPFRFLPNAEKYRNYIYSISRRDQNDMIESEIITIAKKAFESFNSAMGTKYSLDNIKIELFNMTNVAQTYTSFVTANGFPFEDPSKRDFSLTVAEAFVGNTDCEDPSHVDGILVSTELPADFENKPSTYFEAFTHELAHIFCTTHEIPTAQKAGQRFFDLYYGDDSTTTDDSIMNSQFSAGYAIWREVIADIITCKISSRRAPSIDDIIEQAMQLSSYVTVLNCDSKIALQRYLSILLTTREIKNARSKISVIRTLEQYKLPFQSIVLMVYDNIKKEPFYAIDYDFIIDLGTQYIAARIQNTKPEELAAYAHSHGLKF